jgi:poly(hydroxyalkanoate) granule-associated protein
MVEKLKEAGEGGSEELAARIRESATQIWLAGLGAFAKAQEEGTKIFEALVKEGEAVQERTRKVAGDRMAEMAAQASGTWDKTWDRLEQVFEDRVGRALHSLNVPSKQDIDTLNQRVAKLAVIAERIAPARAKAGGRTKTRSERAYQGSKPKVRRRSR